MHGEHCHCDDGYALSGDGVSCETESNANNVDTSNGFAFDPQQVQALTGTENNTQMWILEAIEDDVQLSLEIYESFGGLSSPGSAVIDENETNYATCGNCIVLQTGCSLHGDHYHCERTFMPKSGGEIHIDQIGRSAGEAFIGELLGIEFQEVSIAQDYQTNAISDGDMFTLNPWSFETELSSR